MSEIRNGYHILEQCIYDGFVTEELIETYKLSGIKRTDYTSEFNEDDFPNQPVKNQIGNADIQFTQTHLAALSYMPPKNS